MVLKGRNNGQSDTGCPKTSLHFKGALMSTKKGSQTNLINFIFDVNNKTEIRE